MSMLMLSTQVLAFWVTVDLSQDYLLPAFTNLSCKPGQIAASFPFHVPSKSLRSLAILREYKHPFSVAANQEFLACRIGGHLCGALLGHRCCGCICWVKL